MNATRGGFSCLIGIPYVDGGRTMDGADCWGLVCLAFAREAAITLPSYGDISAADLLAVARMIRRETQTAESGRLWIPLAGDAEPRRLDVAVMRRLGHPSGAGYHTGVCNGDGRLLHTERGTDSHLVALDAPQICGRVLSIFRHRNLCEGRMAA